MRGGEEAVKVRSIRARLILGLLVPLTLLASAVSVEAYFSVRRTSDELHDATLHTVLLTLSEHMLANDNELVAENLLEVLTESLGDQFFYHFVAPGNAWVIGYSGVPGRPDGVEPESGRAVFYDGEYRGDPVRAVATRQLARGRGLDGWTTLTVWRRVEQRRALALALFSRSLWRLALLVGAAGLVTYWAVSRGLRPLDDLREAVAKRSPEDLSPIRRAVPVELRPIAASMNALFARLSEANRARERFVGDAAHQLRNPVAALRTQAQNVVAASRPEDARARAESLVGATERLGRLVDQMLVSASSHSGSARPTGTVDLAALAAGVAREHGGRALATGRELSFDSDADAVPVRGHEVLLREMLSNLVDNAIRHNDPGASIAVRVAGADAASEARVDVSDTGEAFDERRLGELVAPFRTGDGQAAGSGLGLSIVADIVRLHGGTLEVRPAHGSRGKTLRVRLPRQGAAGIGRSAG